MLQVSSQTLKCIKNFKPLQIITTHADKRKEIFSVLNSNGEKIGIFQLNNDQFVSNLELKPNVRRSKTAVNALLSIKEFIEQKIKAKGLDYFEFEVNPKNKHNLEKLYNRLGMDFIEKLPNGNLFYIGITNPKQRKAILDDFASINSLTFF